MLEKNIIYYKEIDSTQKEIWRRIKKGNIDDMTVIVADVQTDAIGTHGRKWYTTQENNIAFSFSLFPNVKVSKLEHLTIEIAEILLDIFEKEYGVLLSIKEPNDIMINGKKVGGILTETKLQGEIVKVLVIGIGININQMVFHPEIESIATSIQKEFGICVNHMDVIQKFLHEFEQRIIKPLEKQQ